jgi:hypothetical protein
MAARAARMKSSNVHSAPARSPFPRIDNGVRRFGLALDRVEYLAQPTVAGFQEETRAGRFPPAFLPRLQVPNVSIRRSFQLGGERSAPRNF